MVKGKTAKEKKRLRKEMMKESITLIVAAFAFVAALAWRDAVTHLFGIWFGEQGNLIALVVYALIVTVTAVFAAAYLGRLKGKWE